MQARWGCPVAGHSAPAALDPDLAAESERFARLVGTQPVATCPFACIRHADPWVVEVTEAVALAQPENGGAPLETTLGRDLTRADVQALAVLARAKADVWRSDRAIEEQKRKRGRKP